MNSVQITKDDPQGEYKKGDCGRILGFINLNNQPHAIIVVKEKIISVPIWRLKYKEEIFIQKLK